MLTDIMLSRTIGPVGRGIYAMIITTNLLLIGLLIFGMGYAPTYFLAKKKASLKEVHSAVVISVGILSLITAILFLFFQGLFGRTVSVAVRRNLFFIVVLMPLGFYKQCWFSVMIGLNKVIDLGKANVLFAIIALASMAIFLVGLKLGLFGSLLAVFISDSLIVLVMLLRIAAIGGWGFTLRTRLLREMAVFGGIAHLGNIAVQLYQRLVIYILGAMASMAQVGYYTLAMNIAEKQLTILNPIITASNYRIIGDEKGPAEVLLAKVIRFSSTILLFACLMIIPASRWIIRLLYGKAFEPAAIPLMILMPGVAIHGLSCIFALYFSGQLGKPIITMKIAFFCLFVSLPICWFLTRSFLLPGAAVSTTIIYCIAFLPLVHLFAKKSRIKPTQYFLLSLNELKQASFKISLFLHAEKLR